MGLAGAGDPDSRSSSGLCGASPARGGESSCWGESPEQVMVATILPRQYLGPIAAVTWLLSVFLNSIPLGVLLGVLWNRTTAPGERKMSP